MTIQLPIPSSARFDVLAHAERLSCTPSRFVQLAWSLAASRETLAIFAIDGVHILERSGQMVTMPERGILAATWTEDGRHLALARGHGVALIQPGVIEQRWVNTSAPIHQLVTAGPQLVGCTADGALVRIDVTNGVLVAPPPDADDGNPADEVTTVLVAVDVERGWFTALERARDDEDEDNPDGLDVATKRWPSLAPLRDFSVNSRFSGDDFVGDDGEPLYVTGLRFLASGRLAVALTSEQANVLMMAPRRQHLLGLGLRLSRRRRQNKHCFRLPRWRSRYPPGSG